MKKLYIVCVLCMFVFLCPQWGKTEELIQTKPLGTNLGASLKETATAWVELIDSAQSQIFVSQFYVAIFEDDGKTIHPAMQSVLNALERAVKRHVQIYMLVDKKFYKNYPQSYEHFKALSGVHWADFDLSQKTGGINHSKYWIVDGRIAYVGSANLDWRSLTHIHEMGLIVDNTEAVADLCQVFEYDWLMMTQTKIQCDPVLNDFVFSSSTYFTASPKSLLPKHVDFTLPELRHIIRNTQSTLQLALHSFKSKGYDGSEWMKLHQDIQKASRRGVKIEILLGSWMFKKGIPQELIDLSKSQNITIRVLDVPLYHNKNIPFARVLHSKMMVVDGKKLWLSTANWAKDYFYDSRNVDVITEVNDVVRDAQNTFQILWSSPYTKHIDEFKSENKN